MQRFNLNVICEQVLFENALALISENAEKLVNIKDYADEADNVLTQTKEIAKAQRGEIDYTGLKALRNELKELLRNELWPTLNGEALEAKLDDYILTAIQNPSTVFGIQGERLSPTLQLKGLRYLHRRWLGLIK